MKHDLSKLHPIHQRTYREFVSSIYTPDKVPDELYEIWLKLSKIPKKDWGKPETIEKLKSKTDKG